MKQHRRTNSINPSPIISPPLEESDADEIDYSYKAENEASLYNVIVGSPSRWAISFGLTILFILLCVQAFEKIGNKWGKPFQTSGPYTIIPPKINGENIMLELVEPILLNGKCENTLQGKEIITDSLGFVCKRENMDPKTQCCKQQPSSTNNNQIVVNQRFSCSTCNSTTSCCSSYEYCVTCCMDPQRYSLKSLVIKNSLGQLDSLRGERNSFKYCRAVCRTSSKSVFAINQYRNNEKHCYGPNGPPIGEEQAKLVGVGGKVEEAIDKRKLSSNEEPPFEVLADKIDENQYPQPLFEFKQISTPSFSSAERKNIGFTFWIASFGLILFILT